MENHISSRSLALVSLSNFQWSLLLLGLVCLFGCETYQHENLKVGQSEMVAVEVMESYVDTKVVMERLKGQGIKIQLDSLLKLAEMTKNFNGELALTYAQEANRIAVESGQEISQGISVYYTTLLNSRQQIFGEGLEEMIVDAKMGIRLFEKNDRKDWLININNLLGIIYYQQSKNDSAFVYLNKALLLLEDIKLSKKKKLNLKGDIYLDLGNVYSTIDTTKAITFYNQSRLAYDSTQNVVGSNRLKVTLGYFYLYDLGSIEKAEMMFQQSLDYALVYKDNKVQIECYEGLIYLRIQQFKDTKDEKHLLDALNYLRKQLKNQKENFYYTYQLIGYIFQEQNDNYSPSLANPTNNNEQISYLDSAIINYKKAVFFAQEESQIQTMKTIGNDIAELCALRKEKFNIDCDSLLGNPHFVFLNENYNGIVTNITKNLEVANNKIRTYEKREQAVIHQQRIYRNWVITGSSLAFSVLIFLLILQKLQQKRLLAKMEALRAQINPHFISNSLNAIESLVNLNKRKEASKYLVHFSRLSRRILNGSREAFVSLTEELETLEHFLALEQLRFRDKLHFDIAVQEGLNPKIIQVPAMIMQPYVENAIWHGIKPKEEPGLLKIIIEKDKKKLVCIIEDNGIGRVKAKELKENSVLKHKSQGMQISKERLEALGKMKGAKIQMIDLTDKAGKAIGTRVILRFPLKYKK